MGDPCSRFYAPDEFNVLAACLHAVTEHWQFKYIVPSALSDHPKCVGKKSNNVVVGDDWTADPVTVLDQVVGAA